MVVLEQDYFFVAPVELIYLKDGIFMLNKFKDYELKGLSSSLRKDVIIMFLVIKSLSLGLGQFVVCSLALKICIIE